MAKYLLQGNYVGDGIGGLLKEGGTARFEAVKKAAESLGGSIDCFYYAFGDTDVLGIGDFPDDASAAAFSLMAASSGRVTVTTTPLMSPETLDEAAAKSPDYRPPGS